ncbi:MAG: NAD(P)/FAD-dependent oxidoreductase [Verrucomicrobiota bacterium]
MSNAGNSGEYDVIIIGGGPCGSTAAALLAEKGRSVLVVEKAKFPRYHVGESLMPFCYFTLDRLGLIDEVNRLGFVNKLSVQFVTQDGGKSRPFYFFQHYDHPSSTTWQVERSEFDMMLMDRAKGNGAEVWEETKVDDVLTDESGAVVGVSVSSKDGEKRDVRAPMTIDASGRDGLVISKRKWRKRDPQLNKIAIWTYYRGAMRDEGLDAGSTTVAYLPDKGWFWYIPLKDDIVSVGVVAERDYLYADSRDPAEIMAGEAEKNEWIREHLEPSEQFGEYWVTGEYSYRSEYCAGDGLVLAGDAFAFLDPVFSSGVFLALKTGEMAADAVDAALAKGDTSAGQFEGYGEKVCEMIEVMRKLVYAFYDEGFSFGKVIRKHPDVQSDLTDCLIGKLDGGEFKELFEAVAEFAELPPELAHGRRVASAEAAAAG